MTTLPISEPLAVPHAEEHAPRGGCTNCASAIAGYAGTLAAFALLQGITITSALILVL